MSDSPQMPTSYYDEEASRYDESRGGEDRARAAAASIASLVPGGGRLLDVAGGTGSVSVALADLGWSPVVLDLSAGMLAVAGGRLPGRAVLGSADRLPVRDASVELVTVIWMLNLIPPAVVDAVIAEAARVLRVGGSLVVTVDKELAHSAEASAVSDGDADHRSGRGPESGSDRDRHLPRPEPVGIGEPLRPGVSAGRVRPGRPYAVNPAGA